ncbi:MAG: hypothetical protein JXM79_02595 [Sedimentisphaerales bacterium]|nr:hypothetical protein [Sedimentisphaerales bacterium]
MRKFLIGFVSLGIVLGLYTLYIRTGKTPDIDTDRAAKAIKSTADGNAIDPNSEMGKIGDVGIGPVRQARYVTLNPKTKEVEREFGFEKLLHEVRDVWEIEKPYMNVYRRNFKCFITADRGQVQVETVVNRTTPKDATFSSNVVIHLVPTETGTMKECYVYLDDIIFLSDQSLLKTNGPIRFDSEDAKMHGKGLRLIFNEQAERLEYFQIADLETMSYRITKSQAAFFSNYEMLTQSHPQNKTQEPNETIIVKVSEKEEIPPAQDDSPIEQEPREGEYYTCILNDNVLIDTPGQRIFADKKLQIHDIFWSKEFITQSDEAEPAPKQESQNKNNLADPNEPVSSPPEPNDAPEETPTFITITCDGELLIVPKDSPRIQKESEEAGIVPSSDPNHYEHLDDGTKRTKFFARTIDYHAVTGDMTAGGLSELTYYGVETTTSKSQPSSDKAASGPLKVTARNGAIYTKVSNRIVFNDCLCTVPRAGLTEQQDVTFSAPRITVDLPPEDVNTPDSPEEKKQLEILAAGPVELSFYMEPTLPRAKPDLIQEDANQPATEEEPSTLHGDGALIPVTVTATRRAYYLAELNQMAFEGDCQCMMIREDPNVIEKYILRSERMTVDLAEDANDRTSGPAADLEHLTATGEVVRLATTRTAKAGGAFADVLEDANGTGLLSGIELKCRQFDYDAVQQLFWATGPGIIWLNNALGSDPNEPSRPFSLREPCWAYVSGFDTLRYSLLENRIVADATPNQKLGIDYLPTTNSANSRDGTAMASHVEAVLRETAKGQTELSTLNATGGIIYEDNRNHQFLGSELFYDHTTGIVRVKGDELQPCFYNGILSDQIQYDVKTDKVKSDVVGPGSIQLGY